MPAERNAFHGATPSAEMISHTAGETDMGTAVNFLDEDSPLSILPSGNTEVDKKVTAVTRAELVARRDAILGLPTNEAGIDLDSINDYRKKLGAPKKELRILDPGLYTEAIAISEARDDQEGGRFLPQQDVIVLSRSPELEELNGTGLIASLGVHEIVHSWTRPEIRVSMAQTTTRAGVFRRKVSDTVIPETVRTGYIRALPDGSVRGSAIEEGHAEYERGQYVVDDLNRPNGFSDEYMSGEHKIQKYTFLQYNQAGESKPTCLLSMITK